MEQRCLSHGGQEAGNDPGGSSVGRVHAGFNPQQHMVARPNILALEREVEAEG